MRDFHRELLEVLSRYLSSVNARSLLTKAIREASLTPDALTAADLPRIMGRLERGIRLFLDPAQHEPVWRELRQLSGYMPIRSQTIPILIERDVSEARVVARRMCQELGARPFILQKVATIASELARNIVAYTTTGGSLELTPIQHPPPPRVSIEARDSGPGIQALDEVLAGWYKSKTGLGKGICGVKRLANKFDIATGARGTRVSVEVYL